MTFDELKNCPLYYHDEFKIKSQRSNFGIENNNAPRLRLSGNN